MTKKQIAQTFNTEISLRMSYIDQAKSGVLLHLNTPAKVDKYIEEQEDKISEVRFLALKLRVKLG